MDNFQQLNIKLQMESLITEREGMIAENAHRAREGQAQAFTIDDFIRVQSSIESLIDVLRRIGG